jgi:sugar-specific transcriptional regulator TrmB
MSATAAARHRRRAPSVDPKVEEGLRNLGLTDYEIRVYMAILRHPQSRIPEVARWSAVPQPKVYATVKRLIERGLCESHLGPVNQYSAISPQEAFEPLLDDLRGRHNEAKSAVLTLRSEHAKASRPLSRREGRIKVFQGRPAAARNFKFLLANARLEVGIIARVPFVVSDDEEIIRDRIAAGVKIRLLVEIPAQLSPQDRQLMEEQVRAGSQLRTIEEVPMRLALFDSKITTMPMLDPAPAEGDGFIMLEIRNESLTRGMTKVFDMLWAVARDL